MSQLIKFNTLTSKLLFAWITCKIKKDVDLIIFLLNIFKKLVEHDVKFNQLSCKYIDYVYRYIHRLRV